MQGKIGLDDTFEILVQLFGGNQNAQIESETRNPNLLEQI